MAENEYYDCPHDANYMCPRCGQCLPCAHKQKTSDVVWWVCKDGTMLRLGKDMRIVEQVKRG